MNENIPKSTQDIFGRFLSQWRNKIVAKEIRPPFLDIACGLNLLTKEVSDGTGIDIVDYGSADVVVKDFANLPFESESFQSIAIVASLNYFDNPKGVLSECSRILQPGGILILTMLDPFIGKVIHLFRERWVELKGIKSEQIKKYLNGTELHLIKKRKFMFGLNNLYLIEKT